MCYTDLQKSEQTTDVCTAAGRLRKICPVEDCDARVVHLPRHLRECHEWMSDDARNAVKCYRLRKIHSHSTARHLKYKDYHKARPCPVEGCTCVVTRLAFHLRSCKIPQHSPLYRELLIAARKTSRSTRSKSTTSTSAVKNRDVAANGVLNGNTGDMECSDDDDA